MSVGSRQSELFPAPPQVEQVVVINGRCQVRTWGDRRVIVVGGTVVAQYAVGDRMSEALGMVNLAEQGYAEQVDVAQAFGCTARTVRRYQDRFERCGLAGLGRGAGYPRGRGRLRASRACSLLELKGQGVFEPGDRATTGGEREGDPQTAPSPGLAGADRGGAAAVAGSLG